MIDFSALRQSEVRTHPYRYMVGSGTLSPQQAADIRTDYPDIKDSGFLPLSELTATGAFKSLIDDLQSAELAEVLSERLDLELMDKPRMITVRRHSKTRDGRMHTDSESKICTMLVYLNETWEPSEGGAIRVFETDNDINTYVEEVVPLAGNVFAFARADNSWHGHAPFAGERYVVQTTFLASDDELKRKEHRGKLQTFIKKINVFDR